MNNIRSFYLSFFLILINCPVNGQLPTIATDISPVLVGETIPATDLFDSSGNSLSVHTLLEGRKTLIVFYRGNWCPRCLRYLATEFVPNISTIEQLGFRFFAICPDAPPYLLKTSNETGMNATYLLSDVNASLIRLMGLGYKADKYAKYIDQTSDGTNSDYVLPATAVYIIGPGYKVLFNFITPEAVNGEDRMQWELLYPILKTLNDTN